MSATNEVLSAHGIEKLVAALVAGMIIEASYRGEEVTAAEISNVICSDPDGATAHYFRQGAADSLDWIRAFRADPDLLDCFPGGAP